MKKSWWKVPLYCMVASWICFGPVKIYAQIYLQAPAE